MANYVFIMFHVISNENFILRSPDFKGCVCVLSHFWLYRLLWHCKCSLVANALNTFAEFSSTAPHPPPLPLHPAMSGFFLMLELFYASITSSTSQHFCDCDHLVCDGVCNRATKHKKHVQHTSLTLFWHKRLMWKWNETDDKATQCTHIHLHLLHVKKKSLANSGSMATMKNICIELSMAHIRTNSLRLGFLP